MNGFLIWKRSDFDWIAERFQEYYEAHKRELSLHEGVEDLLRRFEQEGCHQIILSSSATRIIEQHVKRFGLTHYFDAVLGANDLLAAGKIERRLTISHNKKYQEMRRS